MALGKGTPEGAKPSRQAATWKTAGGKVIQRFATAVSQRLEEPTEQKARGAQADAARDAGHEQKAQAHGAQHSDAKAPEAQHGYGEGTTYSLAPEETGHAGHEPHRADSDEQSAAARVAHGLADEARPTAEHAAGAGAEAQALDLFAQGAASDAEHTHAHAAGQSFEAGAAVAHGSDSATTGQRVTYGAGRGNAEAGRARTYEVTRGEHAEAVIVYCSDPRFQGAFEEFIEKELGLARGTFVPIVVAGGGGVLARPQELPKEFKFMKERLELARENFPSIRRVILIGHEDCRYYESLKGRLLGLLGAKAAALVAPRGDLGTASKLFQQLLAHLGVTVEMYYAKFADEGHTRVGFEKIRG